MRTDSAERGGRRRKNCGRGLLLPKTRVRFSLTPRPFLCYNKTTTKGGIDMTAKGIIRFPFQIIALLLQIYFIVETIRLYFCGYVMYMGEPIESAWFSMLFTLLVVIACEVVSFIDAILFVSFKKNKYSKIYLTLVIVNACCFMTMAYYNTVGTTICLSLYAVLFILRVINVIVNFIDILKKV